MEKEHKAKISGAILWIVVYFIGMPISRKLLGLIGIMDWAPPIYRIVFVWILFLYMKKKQALSYYGIRSLKELDSKALLYYIPFGLMVIANLSYGFDTALSWEQILIGIITALCVGFIEEILFRGFLFKALLEKGKIFAIIISAFAFGFVHILNLTVGADIVVTIMQIISAAAFGFACAVFIYKTKNIIPCFICHELINTVGSFVKENRYYRLCFVRSYIFGVWNLFTENEQGCDEKNCIIEYVLIPI